MTPSGSGCSEELEGQSCAWNECGWNGCHPDAGGGGAGRCVVVSFESSQVRVPLGLRTWLRGLLTPTTAQTIGRAEV